MPILDNPKNYNMDLKSKINSWWAKGATNRETMEPTMEKTQRELQNPLPGENQPTICLICDQTFESKRHCLEHIQILHGLQNSIENYHYKIKSHSEENSINSINPAPPVKLDEQGSKDGTTKPKPKVTTTHTKTKRPNYPIKDPLGSMNEFKFPAKYMEEVKKLTREDDILIPVPQIIAEANQEFTHTAPPQNVLALHSRLVHGTTHLYDVPKSSILDMIRSPYMRQAYGPKIKSPDNELIDTCIFCKTKMHKYQFFCKTLKKLQPQEIRRVMKDYDINCELCLGTYHTTEHCLWSTRCIKCGAKHCSFLHEEEEKKNKMEISEEKHTEVKESCSQHFKKAWLKNME